MIKDIVVGLMLIVYVFSSMACFVLCKELILDVCSAAIPKLEDNFRQYADHKLSFTWGLLALSIIPVANLFIAAGIYFHYDAIRAEMVEEFKQGPRWDKIQEDYNQLVEMMENE